MLAVIAGIGVAVFLFMRMDDEIRHQAERFLADKFPHLNVSVGGARLVEGRGIAIYDLAISETSTTQLQSNLLVVDEIFLVCDAQLTRLVHGLPEIQKILQSEKYKKISDTNKKNNGWEAEEESEECPSAAALAYA